MCDIIETHVKRKLRHTEGGICTGKVIPYFVKKKGVPLYEKS